MALQLVSEIKLNQQGSGLVGTQNNNKMSKLSVISPAPTRNIRVNGTIRQGAWETDFIRRATRLDTEGFPIEGTFGTSFGLKKDVNTLTRAERAEADPQLLKIHGHIKKGDIMAFKRGKTIIAFVEITSDYRFCPEEYWGWHTWSYRLVRKARPSDQPANKGALIRTFMPNFLARPMI